MFFFIEGGYLKENNLWEYNGRNDATALNLSRRKVINLERLEKSKI